MSNLVLYDTVIVGAGAAGLTAAYELIRRGQKNVRILEASPQWGGRVRKVDNSFADFPLDIGGSWIHENDDSSPNSRVLKTIVNNPNVAVTTKTAVDDRTYLMFEDGNRLECPAEGDGGPSSVLDEIFIGSSWYSFLETYIYPTAKDYIMYNCVVDLIDYSSQSSAYLECANGNAMMAKKVIVTASVEVLRTGMITFVPPLPQEKTAILEKYSIERVLKGFIKFSNKFYEAGKSFEIYPPFYGDENGELSFWDAAFKQTSSSNVLGVFITNRYLDDFASLSDAQILSKLLDHIDIIYGGRARASYVKHVFQDWTKEPYILGGWSVTEWDTAQYRSDLWTLLKPLGNGRIYFAGEAFPHDEWSTTVPAAALSGQTAACRVMGGTLKNLYTDCKFPTPTTRRPTRAPTVKRPTPAPTRTRPTARPTTRPRLRSVAGTITRHDDPSASPISV